MTEFSQRLLTLMEKKETILCVGLDAALPRQRERNTIPLRYLETPDENEAKLRFCLDILEQVENHCVGAKPNQQYVIGFTKEQHRRLTDAIRDCEMVSILDYKLNDVGETVESAIFHLTECGYDAITFNPLPGNLAEAVNLAHGLARKSRGYEMGIIVLTLMSNREAVKYMKEARMNGKPLYAAIAEDVRECKADGCVVGATGHVIEENIKQIRAIVGNDRVFLVPGVGAQRGDPERIIRAGGRNILINVGRDIIYSSNPTERAKYYHEMFSRTKKEIEP